jgi:hypothetical protein
LELAHIDHDSPQITLVELRASGVTSCLAFASLPASGKTEDERRLIAFQTALFRVFGDMNRSFQSRRFDFSDDVARSFGKFLTGFDTIFTLNQDLLLELHYHRSRFTDRF